MHDTPDRLAAVALFVIAIADLATIPLALVAASGNVGGDAIVTAAIVSAVVSLLGGPILAQSSQEGLVALVAPIEFILLVTYGLGALVTTLPGVLFLVLLIADPRAGSQPATSMILALCYPGAWLLSRGAQFWD